MSLVYWFKTALGETPNRKKRTNKKSGGTHTQTNDQATKTLAVAEKNQARKYRLKLG